MARRVPHELGSIEFVDDFAVAESDWRLLANCQSNVFATFDWARTWWRHFGYDRTLHIGVCRERDGTSFAIVPLYCAQTRPVRVFRFIGYGVSDQLGPVCAAENRRRVGRLVSEWLMQRRIEPRILLAGPVAGDEGWRTHFGAVVRATYPSYVADLQPGGWGAYERLLSGQLRGQIKRKKKRLEDAHNVTLRLTSSPAQSGRDMNLLFDLHSRRWGAGRRPLLPRGARSIVSSHFWRASTAGFACG